MFLVSTTDFFYPLVEDPFLQGRIACCNVLSDLYAVGIVDIDSMLMLLASSLDMPVDQRHIVTKLMIHGFSQCATEAGTMVTGGHSILNPWPIIGGVAKAICKAGDFIEPDGAQAGDVLILTKPLGTQLAVNAKQWMSQGALQKLHDVTVDEAQAAFLKAQSFMARLNRNGARLMHKHGAHAATDVTGFGILGHVENLSRAQKQPLRFRIHTMPIIAGMARLARSYPGFRLMKGYSAETSGGLLVSLPPSSAAAFIEDMFALGECAWLVGDVTAGDRGASISADVSVVDV